MIEINRWKIYEALKKEQELDIKEISLSNAEEVKEGFIEFLLFKKRVRSSENGGNNN